MNLLDDRWNRREHELQATRQQVVEDIGALVRDMRHLDPQAPAEHVTRQMRRGANAGRAVIQFAGIRSCVSHELLETLDSDRRIHDEYIRPVGYLYYRYKV